MQRHLRLASYAAEGSAEGQQYFGWRVMDTNSIPSVVYLESPVRSAARPTYLAISATFGRIGCLWHTGSVWVISPAYRRHVIPLLVRRCF